LNTSGSSIDNRKRSTVNQHDQRSNFESRSNMAHQKTRGFNILGVSVQGDLGGITYYTSARRQLVAFAKAPPLNPPSPKQIAIRSVWSDAAEAWRNLTDEQRETWYQLDKRLRMRLTAYNIWIWFYRSRDEEQLQTIERKAGLTLPRPPAAG